MPNAQRLVADMEAIPDVTADLEMLAASAARQAAAGEPFASSVTADLARIREMDAAWSRAAEAMGRMDFAAFDAEMVAFRAARDGAK